MWDVVLTPQPYAAALPGTLTDSFPRILFSLVSHCSRLCGHRQLLQATNNFCRSQIPTAFVNFVFNNLMEMIVLFFWRNEAIA